MKGKGKITDFISKDYDDVVRFNGGSNAGHTVVINGEKFKFHHYGIFQKRKVKPSYPSGPASSCSVFAA